MVVDGDAPLQARRGCRRSSLRAGCAQRLDGGQRVAPGFARGAEKRDGPLDARGVVGLAGGPRQAEAARGHLDQRHQAVQTGLPQRVTRVLQRRGSPAWRCFAYPSCQHQTVAVVQRAGQFPTVLRGPQRAGLQRAVAQPHCDGMRPQAPAFVGARRARTAFLHAELQCRGPLPGLGLRHQRQRVPHQHRRRGQPAFAAQFLGGLFQRQPEGCGTGRPLPLAAQQGRSQQRHRMPPHALQRLLGCGSVAGVQPMLGCGVAQACRHAIRLQFHLRRQRRQQWLEERPGQVVGAHQHAQHRVARAWWHLGPALRHERRAQRLHQHLGFARRAQHLRGGAIEFGRTAAAVQQQARQRGQLLASCVARRRHRAADGHVRGRRPRPGLPGGGTRALHDTRQGCVQHGGGHLVQMGAADAHTLGLYECGQRYLQLGARKGPALAVLAWQPVKELQQPFGAAGHSGQAQGVEDRVQVLFGQCRGFDRGLGARIGACFGSGCAVSMRRRAGAGVQAFEVNRFTAPVDKAGRNLRSAGHA